MVTKDNITDDLRNIIFHLLFKGLNELNLNEQQQISLFDSIISSFDGRKGYFYIFCRKSNNLQIPVIAFIKKKSPKKNGAARLDFFYVEKHLQRKGFGTYAIKKIKSKFDSDTGITLSSHKNTQIFYKKAGFNIEPIESIEDKNYVTFASKKSAENSTYIQSFNSNQDECAHTFYEFKRFYFK